MMYRILPSVRVAWRDVWHGAFATALLFTIGKFLIGLYLGKAGVASGFGAAGSIVVLLVWVFYSAQIFLLGAEYTWLYAHSHGSRAAEGEVPSKPHNQAEPARPQPMRLPASDVPAAWREAASPASRRAGASDIATASLVWLGFGAVRSLLGRNRALSQNSTVD
jgi:membrane protein